MALLVELVEDTPPFLLDVRTAAELEENGHIEGATHIPLDELAQHIDLLPAFDTPIVAYCGTGWRATIAMTALHGMGWTDVRALKITFADWKMPAILLLKAFPNRWFWMLLQLAKAWSLQLTQLCLLKDMAGA